MTLPLLAALLPLFALQTQEEEKYDHGHVYRLPYEGKSRRVSQASNGATHKGKSAHAIDFSMPRKTRIIAARAGMVTRVVERHEELSKAEKKELRERGKQPKANTVTIRHEDMHSNQDWELHEGFEVTGWPVMTLSRGEIIVENGKVLAQPGRGKMLRRRKFGEL